MDRKYNQHYTLHISCWLMCHVEKHVIIISYSSIKASPKMPENNIRILLKYKQTAKLYFHKGTKETEIYSILPPKNISLNAKKCDRLSLLLILRLRQCNILIFC